MMTDIKGYRELSDATKALLNNNRIMEERLLRALDVDGVQPDIDARWLAIARTHFEEGFMALNRAITRPGRIELPEDDEGVS